MKKIISLFVIATMIVACMSFSVNAADVTSTAQFAFDGTVNKLTADIMGADRLTLSNASDNLVVDLNGFTWQSIDIVLKIDNGATVEIYDSSEAKTGKIQSGNDAIDMSNGTLTLKNITVEGGDAACDAIFANGGTITVEGCTLSAGKAALGSANGSSVAGVPVVATVKDTTFARYVDYPSDRNCAIELRSSSYDQKITLVGNNVFENNKIMIRDDYTKDVAEGIVAGEGATVSFTDPVSVAGRNNYTYCEIFYNHMSYDSEYGYASSWGTCGESVDWTLYDDGTLVISGTGAMYDYDYGDVPWYEHRSSLKNVIIEDGVTTIGRYAFYKCTNLTSVTIPDGVTTIGDFAFYNCTSLTTVTIGNGVTTIGYRAFSECTSLTSITVDTDNGAYSSDEYGILFDKNKTTLIQYPVGNERASYTIPASVTIIGDSAFYNCSNLKSVTIGNGVTTISSSAFDGCESLTSVTIGNGVTTIGWSAFGNCTSLTSVTIPNSVTTIGDSAFYNCSNLKSVTIGNGVTAIGGYVFYNCTSLTSVTIPDSVTITGDSVFYNCSNLKSVTIGNGVTTIGGSAFENCTSLTSVTIGNGVTNIDPYAFKNCTNIQSVYVSDLNVLERISFGNEQSDPTYYGAQLYLLNGDETVMGGFCGENVVWYLYDDGTFIISGTGAVNDYSQSSDVPWYEHRSSIKNVIIEDGVTTIGSYAFSGCKSLTSVTIPDSVTTIGKDAFYYCRSLTLVIIPDSVTSIGEYAFSDCTSLKSVTIGNGVTTMGDCAFYNCSNLKSVTISNGVTTIGGSAFYDCASLKSVTIPDSVTTIGSCAFYGCESLTSVTIPDSVTTIGIYAFFGCASLTSATIPSSVTAIGEFVFGYCMSLASVSIPDGVMSIGSYAFSECTSLTSVTIGKSITAIGENAFRGCTSISNVYITDLAAWCSIDFNSVTSNPLYYYANLYLNGEKLKDAVIPNGVTAIKDHAFYNCASIMTVNIPDSVDKIGVEAFYGCRSLISMAVGSGVKTVGADAFKNCTGLCSVYITDMAAWCSIPFENEYASPMSYADDLYLNGELVSELVIPNGITTVNSYAFQGAECITSLIIPEGVVTISEKAFYGCTGIQTVSLPLSIVKIGPDAFSDKADIKSVYYAGNENEWENMVINGNLPLTQSRIVFGLSLENSGSQASEHGACVSIGVFESGEWALFEDGYLKINGSGDISFRDLPFYKYRNDVKTVCVNNGITSIPDDMFYKCSALESIIIPESVTHIGDGAFLLCDSLTNVYYGGNLQQWSEIVIEKHNDVLDDADIFYEYAAFSVESVNVFLAPEKTVYAYGEELCLDGMIITQTLSNGNVYELESYTVSPFDKYSYGKQTITVKSGDLSTEFDVVVKASAPSVINSPIKQSTTVGEFTDAYDSLYTVYVLDPDRMTVLVDSDVMKTGCVVQFVRDGKLVDSIGIVVSGDVDGDGRLTAKDFIRLKKQIAQGSWVEYPEYADINRDGVVDTLDLEALALAIA